MKSFTFGVLAPLFAPSLANPTPYPSQPTSGQCYGKNVTYKGLYDTGIEGFIGIRFANDTGGQNRFKPPVTYVPAAHSVINAITTGPACPQSYYGPPSNVTPSSFNFASTDPTTISEDCLRLNVWRPNGTKSSDNLPVLVWIYGGSFVGGFKDNIISQPGGLILESVANGYPIIHVELNYRLGIFGFAQSKALENEGSENAGLRDQRLALEWVHANIAAFGGDPDKITIHGQSSGGLAVGMQIMAFGAKRPFPFQRGICESQALEGGITGNFTREAMAAALAVAKCNSTALDSPATVECLRKLPMKTLLDAQTVTGSSAPAANAGDQWLPVVDGPNGFLPAAPSTLISEGRIGNISTIMGWTETDGVFFTPNTTTAKQTYSFVRQYLPGFTEANIQKLLSLYPISDFQTSRFPNGTTQLSAEKYRSGRILRDILFVCQPLLYGQALAKAGNSVYYYQQNQTIVDEVLQFYGYYGYGPIHTSELAYVFGNLSHYHQYNWPFHPSTSDYKLRDRESRSWSSFVALGQPSLSGHDTLQGWKRAQFTDPEYGVYVIGGPNAGYTGSGGSAQAKAALAIQKLQQRCNFFNSPEVVKQQNY